MSKPTYTKVLDSLLNQDIEENGKRDLHEVFLTPEGLYYSTYVLEPGMPHWAANIVQVVKRNLKDQNEPWQVTG